MALAHTEQIMKLLIAIPALNEEDAIESIIERSLAAREQIIAGSPVTAVDITVVSDGSTDKTVERAGKYGDKIKLIVFEKNRGYGAAIKEAWRQSDADLLGFVDADGTCDPNFFAPLCATIEKERADVVLGCRINSESQMPLIRRFGNFLFATLLSTLSTTRVRDTASGMRVVRAASLGHIYPLPDGLHFTPAMSARAMLSSALKIVEINMSYHERVGESKLHPGKDGLRFLRVIIETAFLYRPSRPFGLVSLVMLLTAAALMLPPVALYLQDQTVEEWMIYRFIVSALIGTGGMLCASASYLSGRIAKVALGDEVGDRDRSLTTRFFRARGFWLVPALFTLGGIALVAGSLKERLITGQTDVHWSRFIVMSFALSFALNLAVTRAIDYVLDLLALRLSYWKTKSGP